MRTCVLSIAGFDPSGGAGVLADVKTFEQLGCTGLAVVTAMTAQQPDRFDKVEWRPVLEISHELDVLAERFSPRAIKIGVVRNPRMLNQLVLKVKSLWQNAIIIWDPVIKPSAGGSFGLDSYRDSIIEYLEGVDIVTPNDEEFQRLFKGVAYHGVIIRTGMQDGIELIDSIYQDGAVEELRYTRYEAEVHGSGCVFSSALTAFMAKGMKVEQSCVQAHDYVLQYLKSSEALVGYHA